MFSRLEILDFLMREKVLKFLIYKVSRIKKMYNNTKLQHLKSGKGTKMIITHIKFLIFSFVYK